MIKVTAIYEYLIKSCAGTSVSTAMIGKHGITTDRRYMVVDEYGVFVTQRNGKDDDAFPTYGVRSMCLIRPSIDYDHSITVRAPDMPELTFLESEKVDELFDVRIWKNICKAQEVSREASEWFTTYMSRERPGKYRLVSMPAGFNRPASAGSAFTRFTDGFPFLIVSKESLDNLNGRILGKAVPMNRFRPNIVISGVEHAYDEDRMDLIEIGGVKFEGHWTCDRCPMPGIEQETGRKDGRPLAALAKYRKTKPGSDKVQFGRNYNHLGVGMIGIGDKVEVLRWAT